MSKTLRIRLNISITDVFNKGILFESWLPPISHILKTNVGALQIEVWIDPMKFQIGPFQIEPSQLSESGDIRIGVIGMDVLVTNVPEDLAEFIHLHSNDTYTDRQNFAGPQPKAYESLGREVMNAAIQTLDKLLTFFRVVKGQFWIPQTYFDPEDIAGFFDSSKAIVRSEAWDWVGWSPSLLGISKSTIIIWTWRKIRAVDWESLDSFLQSQKLPPLPLELLAASELLEAEKRTRVALMEGVTALEVAVQQFLSSSHQRSNKTLLADLEINSTKALYEKLGLRGTLAVLLPLLLSDEELPRDMLHKAIKAIEVRGVVVHRGKREVEQNELRQHLNALRNLSMLLIEHTSK